MLAYKRDLDAFEALDTQVLGVSQDSVEILDRFAAEFDVPFPLISDPQRALGELFTRDRINYLIDRQGIVRLITRGVPANGYLLEKIRALGLAGEGKR